MHSNQLAQGILLGGNKVQETIDFEYLKIIQARNSWKD